MVDDDAGGDMRVESLDENCFAEDGEVFGESPVHYFFFERRGLLAKLWRSSSLLST